MPVARNKAIPEFQPRDMSPQTWGTVRSEAARLGYSNQQITDYLGGSLGGRKTPEVIEAVMEMMRSEDAANVRKARQA